MKNDKIEARVKSFRPYIILCGVMLVAACDCRCGDDSDNAIAFQDLTSVQLYSIGNGLGSVIPLPPGKIHSTELRYICAPDYSVSIPQNAEAYIILEGSGGTINRVTLSRFLTGPGVSGVVVHDYSNPIELLFDELAGESANLILLLSEISEGCFASTSVLYEPL